MLSICMTSEENQIKIGAYILNYRVFADNYNLEKSMPLYPWASTCILQVLRVYAMCVIYTATECSMS